MPRSRSKKLPRVTSLDKLVEFFDTHDLGEFWDSLPEAQFETDIKTRTHLIAIDTDLATQLSAIAHSKRISSERLVNSWIKEKIREQA